MLTRTNLKDFLRYCSDNGISENTLDAYKRDLDHLMMNILAMPATWEKFEQELSDYLRIWRGAWSARTTLRHLSSIKSWGRFMKHPLLEDYKSPKVPVPQPHPIPEGIDGVLSMIDAAKGINARALCALTGLLGLRVHEAVLVRADCFDTVNNLLTVRGKGDKTRVLPVSQKVWAYIKPAYDAAGPTNSRIVPLSQRGARYAIKSHGRRAGLSRDIASHDMRATFATAAYGISHDLRAVQSLLGHADVKTTQVYTGVDAAAMRAAASVI